MHQNLANILTDVKISETRGETSMDIHDVCFDSRLATPSSLFLAFRGTRTDGHNFIEKALESGARAIVCEQFPDQIRSGIAYIRVPDSHEALGQIASNFYERPSEKIRLIGVTGTNGKTTIVSLLHQLFRNLGYGSALLSTIENKINDTTGEATHTTPDPVKLNEFLSKACRKGCAYAFMEVSSHATDQKRIAGLNFAGGVFTNITHEHLDYHGSFRRYLEAKKAFFDALPAGSFALSNADDKNGGFVLQNTRAHKHTYALRSPSDFKGKLLETRFDGLLMQINEKEVWTKLTGQFNAYNLLAVYGTAILLDQKDTEVLREISLLNAADGRFDTLVSKDNITAIVDYAHSPDALDNVLDAINEMRSGNEQLITVVGAGGDRDTQKRPMMAGMAANKSNRVILTSDNPRTETPLEIIKDMERGLDPVNRKKVISITERKEAIKTACALAQPGDIILVAGKGHEHYQEINGIRHPFDDKEILKEFLDT